MDLCHLFFHFFFVFVFFRAKQLDDDAMFARYLPGQWGWQLSWPADLAIARPEEGHEKKE